MGVEGGDLDRQEDELIYS